MARIDRTDHLAQNRGHWWLASRLSAEPSLAIIGSPNVSRGRMSARTTRLANDLSIATRVLGRDRAQSRERLRFANAAHREIAAGHRPGVRVLVLGLNGLSVRLVVDGVPGAIARARTRSHAREIARAAVAASLGLDLYSFDLQVDEA